MDCEDAGGEPAFSAEKTKSRSQKERNRERGELWTLFFFSKNFIEVWLIFNIALSSAAQECDSVIHIQKYIFFFLSFFMWFMTGYLILFLMLYSRTLLFIITTPSPPLPHTLPHGYLMSWPFLVVDELPYPLLMRKSLDTYQKREIKSGIVLGLDICGSHM